MAVNLKVNGATRSVPAEPDTPLLYVLRNDLELNGAKFGCGLAQCGACTVLVDGKAMRSCVTPIEHARQARDHHARRPRHARQAASAAAGLHRRAGRAVRLLHQRHDHDGEGAARPQSAADRGARCARRSPAISAAAAPTTASSRAVLRAAQTRWGGPDHERSHLTRRDFTTGLGRHRARLHARSRDALTQQPPRAARQPADTTGCSTPGCASTPTAPPPCSPARSSWGRAS